MSQIVKQTENILRQKIIQATNEAMKCGELIEGEIPTFIIEKPADKKNGDFSTNIAMAGARSFRKAPKMIADLIVSHIDLSDTLIEKCEIAGPCFINFYLSNDYYSKILLDVIEKGDDYGKSDYGENKRVLVEFVSANPTGPMHIGNARGGAIGDCLASVLSWAGYDVQREFYINDAGNQINKFSCSLECRYLQHYDSSIEVSDDMYKGVDIVEHAENYISEFGDNLLNVDSETRKKTLCEYALPKNIEGLERDLLKYRIVYDKWFKESTLHNSGAVDKIINALKEKGVTYEEEGALWFKASEFGNDKDIVLVRSNGFPTYIVPDIAYHYDKLVTRGYDKAIDVLGADHHGYMARMKAALTALDIDSNRLDFVIMQMVNLVSNGETIKLSKRSGKAITLNTLLDEIPLDAARFFFNLREPNSHFDFDLGLAIEQSSENPAYYVQYAHARICSIIRRAKQEGIEIKTPTIDELNALTSSEERDLITQLSILTGEIVSAAKLYDPAKITYYVLQLATLFHKFYNAHRVITDDEKLTNSRLFMCLAVKNTIKNVLSLLKIDAPESM